MSQEQHYFVNRSLCEVLDEMRKCYETRNFASFLGLVEEAQSMANRMEAGLRDQKDIVEMNKEWHRLKDVLKGMRKEVEDGKGRWANEGGAPGTEAE